MRDTEREIQRGREGGREGEREVGREEEVLFLKSTDMRIDLSKAEIAYTKRCIPPIPFSLYLILLASSSPSVRACVYVCPSLSLSVICLL